MRLRAIKRRPIGCCLLQINVDRRHLFDVVKMDPENSCIAEDTSEGSRNLSSLGKYCCVPMCKGSSYTSDGQKLVCLFSNFLWTNAKDFG